jgi:hypothetical protein
MKVDDSDVRAMVRLVGDVAAISGDHSEKKQFLMDEGIMRTRLRGCVGVGALLSK